MLHLPRWCSLAGVYYFAPEERLKDAEREMKIRKMGMDCSNRLGSTSPPNEAILHFPVGAGRAAVHSSAPRLEAAGSPTFLWINHALGPSQPAPTPPSALMTRTREGSLATCDPGCGMCTGDVSLGGGHHQPPEHAERSWTQSSWTVAAAPQPLVDNTSDCDT